jgi:hypothetical protein
MTEQNLTEPIDERQEIIPRLFSVPGDSRRAAGACSVYDHHGFHDHVATRRHHHAGARYFGRPVRGGGLGLRIQRGSFGILAAGFADQFDRKRLLLFFYVGFTLGTALCAVAPNYHVLLLGGSLPACSAA